MKENHVLLVDDDAEALVSLGRALSVLDLEWQIHRASTTVEALKIVSSVHPQVAVVDLCLDEQVGVESGFDLILRINEQDPTCRVIVLTGHGSLEHGVRSLASGAANFLEKPADISHLSALITDGLRQSNLKREYRLLKKRQEEEIAEIIIGRSRATEQLIETVMYAASNNQAVLITGETGTGKGLCASAIHRFSERKGRPFVRYQPNFAAPDMTNSDLFGHLKGSFTGASTDRQGLLAEANGGTLFFDEVDELPGQTQVTLLGVLQDKCFRPLGSNHEEQVDFRLIAASNQDLEKCLSEGKLRQDFFHRIAHLRIDLLPLRARKDDLEPLARFFLEKMRETEQVNVFHFEEGIVDTLINYDWPGNVRELMAVVEGAAYRAQYQGRTRIIKADLSIGGGRVSNQDPGFHELVNNYRFKLVKEALVHCNNNQVQAARNLGLDRSTLRRILERGE